MNTLTRTAGQQQYGTCILLNLSKDTVKDQNPGVSLEMPALRLTGTLLLLSALTNLWIAQQEPPPSTARASLAGGHGNCPAVFLEKATCGWSCRFGQRFLISSNPVAAAVSCTRQQASPDRGCLKLLSAYAETTSPGTSCAKTESDQDFPRNRSGADRAGKGAKGEQRPCWLTRGTASLRTGKAAGLEHL